MKKVIKISLFSIIFFSQLTSNLFSMNAESLMVDDVSAPVSVRRTYDDLKIANVAFAEQTWTANWHIPRPDDNLSCCQKVNWCTCCCCHQEPSRTDNTPHYNTYKNRGRPILNNLVNENDVQLTWNTAKEYMRTKFNLFKRSVNENVANPVEYEGDVNFGSLEHSMPAPEVHNEAVAGIRWLAVKYDLS